MKSLLTAGIALGLISQPVVAASQEAPPEVIRSVATGCGPGEMFGVDSTRPYEGGRMGQLGAAAAPLQTLEVIATPRSKTVVGVDIWAYQPDDAGTADQRRAFATRLLETLDEAVQASGAFSQRSWNAEDEAIVYSAPTAEPQSDLVLELSQMGVSVIASCARTGRRVLAMDELMGRTRIERPVRPVLPEPRRTALADCDDPVRAEAIYDDFEAGGGHDVMNTVRASSEYFEHLSQWYGQELMDRGVWTEGQRDAFRLSFMQDREIMGGFEQQMARLEPMLTIPLEIADARDAGDAVTSCRAAVRLVDLVAEIGRSNEAMWDRATALYRAEATRLGVTLD